MTIRHYVNGNDPSAFMGEIKKMSFHADNMGLAVSRQRHRTKEGEVELLRTNGIDYVIVSPSVSGPWEMKFVFPIDIPEDLQMSFVIDLNIDGARYFTRPSVSISGSRLTYELYDLLGVITTKYIQISGVKYGVSSIEFSLSLWENGVALGDDRVNPPGRITSANFICYYAVSSSMVGLEYQVLPGYVVPRDFVSWASFLSDGWRVTKNKYAVNVTVAKIQQGGLNSVSIEYKGNEYGLIEYVASGADETGTGVEPLVKIRDDYAYSGTVLNYVNHFLGGATAICTGSHSERSFSWSGSAGCSGSYSESEDTGTFPTSYWFPVTFYGPYSQHTGYRDLPKLYDGLSCGGAMFSTVDGSVWTDTFERNANRTTLSIGFSCPYVSDGGSRLSAHFNLSAVCNISSDDYGLTGSEELYSVAGSYSCGLTLSPPSTITTTITQTWGWTFIVGGGGATSSYSSTETRENTLTWTVSHLASLEPIQLPAKNATVIQSKAPTVSATTYSAGTAGTIE